MPPERNTWFGAKSPVFQPLRRDDTIHGESYYLASEVDAVLVLTSMYEHGDLGTAAYAAGTS